MRKQPLLEEALYPNAIDFTLASIRGNVETGLMGDDAILATGTAREAPQDPRTCPRFVRRAHCALTELCTIAGPRKHAEWLVRWFTLNKD